MSSLRGLDPFVRATMARAKTPGLSLGLAVRGRPIVVRGFGYRDREAKLPATPRTMYGLASVTKSFTALAILQLEEDRRLRVDAPAVRYLPEFRTPDPRRTRRITLHHFLTHTSGLPPLPSIYYTAARSLARDPPFDPRSARRVGIDPRHPPIDTYEGVLEYLATERYRLLGPPGRYFSYSNEAFGLLGAVIERVTGQTYESYVEENLLRPAGMRHTTFDTGILFRFPEVSTLYSPKWTGRRHALVPSQDWWEDTCLRACGALRSNVEDMLRYVEIFRTGGKVGRERVVAARSVRRMLTPHAEIAPGLAYGYGIAIVPAFHGTRVVFHEGGIKGVSSMFAVLPEKGITGVALSNADGAPANLVLQGGINALLGLPLKTPLVEVRSRPGKPSDLRPYAGWYCSGEGIWAQMTPRRGRLQVDFRGIELIDRGLRYRPNGPDEFVLRRHGEVSAIRFERDAGGQLWAAHIGWRLVRRRAPTELRGAARGRMVW